MHYGKDVPERRRQLLVDKPFQYALIRLLGAVWLSNLVVLGGTIYYLYAGPVFRIDHPAFRSIQWLDSSPPQFGLLLTLGATLGLAIVMTVGLHMSHQVAGPLAQLKTRLRQAAEGQVNIELRFRHHDYLGDLPEYFNDMVRSFRERAQSEVERLRAIEASLDESAPARGRLHELLEEKESLLAGPTPEMGDSVGLPESLPALGS